MKRCLMAARRTTSALTVATHPMSASPGLGGLTRGPAMIGDGFLQHVGQFSDYCNSSMTNRVCTNQQVNTCALTNVNQVSLQIYTPPFSLT
jgi:hypothetical protein